MKKVLPLRIFYPLSEIETLWGVGQAELSQWLLQGHLRCHIWLPLSCLYEINEEVEGNRFVQTRDLRNKEGYLQIFPHDFRRLLSENNIVLRDFASEQTTQRFTIPESAPFVSATLKDIVILDDERRKFEKSYKVPRTIPDQLSAPHRSNENVKIDDPGRFRSFVYGGRRRTFGVIQAKVLQLLFEAAEAGSPWQNGKQLLAAAGSQSFGMTNLFKRKPGWRNLIDSDGSGLYRMEKGFAKELRELGSR